MMTSGDREGRIFLSHPQRIIDGLNTPLYVKERIPEVPENVEIRHDMMTVKYTSMVRYFYLTHQYQP